MKDEVQAGGRWVLVNRGAKSQTVNIYTRAHVPGEYEWVLRITEPDRFVVARDLQRLDLDTPAALADHLVAEHGALKEPGRAAPYLR